MRVEHLIYKINQVRNICVYNIITTIFIFLMIIYLETNLIILGPFICLLALYIVCFFLTNEVIDKYKDLNGKFEMSKERFGQFFDNGYLLRILILSIFTLFILFWLYLLIDYSILIIYFSHIDIICYSIFTTFLIWSIKKIIDSFITIVCLTRIIKYVYTNNLLN